LALKDDIESIKNDLIGESRFLEQYIKIEDYLKKHRKKMTILVGVVVALLLGSLISNILESNKRNAANEAYLAYAANPDDKAQLAVIQAKNPLLSTLIELKLAVAVSDTKKLETLAKTENKMLAGLAKYHLAILSGDTKTINEYTLEEGAMLKDFAALQLAYAHFKEGNQKAARDALKKIPFESQLKKSAAYLEHYGLSQ
jgi:hypothetical protein